MSLKPRTVPALCAELQRLQRQRSVVIKSRIMQANRLQAIVAGTLGYSSGMAEKDRRKKFTEASAVIKGVEAGTTDSPMKAIIQVTLIGVNAFEKAQEDLEEPMAALAKLLPVAAWACHKDQRGFGLGRLAIVVGECGDLSNYANPAKVWRRMGCAPYEFGGKTQMGATWRGGKSGKLPAEEWERFGYSPRRRSIAYVIGDLLVKLNGEGPYRTRYDETKATFKTNHPDYSDGRCHSHGMLLATKLLLKELWIEWTGRRVQE